MDFALKCIQEASSEQLADLALAEYFPFSPALPLDSQDVAKYKVHTFDTKFAVVRQGCLHASVDLIPIVNGIPLVLNMANQFNCGGGFDSQIGSQEEHIFHNSTLAASLWPHRREDDLRWPAGSDIIKRRQPPFYPFGEYGGVYSRYVDIVSLDCTPLEHRKQVSVVSIAAQDLRPGKAYNRDAVFDFDLLVQKLRTLLFIALRHGHRALVLGAIGCGAFCNPPAEVANAFRQLLTGAGEFAGAFEVVVFAVILSDANLRAFEAAFGPSIDRARLLAPDADPDAAGPDK